MGLIKKVPKKCDKELFIIRGLPGSGRTCLSKGILTSKAGVILSSDDYFYINNIYTYNSKKVCEAIEANIINCEESCKNGIQCVIIDDSNIKRWEVKPYVEIAKRYNYKVIIREPETTWWKTRDIEEMSKRTSHNISIQAMKKLLQSWDVDFSINSILKEEIPINKLDSLYKYYNYSSVSTNAAVSATTTALPTNNIHMATPVSTVPNVVSYNPHVKEKGSGRNGYLAPKPQRLVNNTLSQPYFKERNHGFNEDRSSSRNGKNHRNYYDLHHSSTSSSSSSSSNYYSSRIDKKIDKRTSHTSNGRNYQSNPPPPPPQTPLLPINKNIEHSNSNTYRVCRPAVPPYSEEADPRYERKSRSKARYYDDSVIPNSHDHGYKYNDSFKRKRSSSIGGENDIYKKRSSSIGNNRYNGRDDSIGYNEGVPGRSSSVGYKGRINNSGNSRGIDSTRYGGEIGNSSRRSSSVGNEGYGYNDRLNRYKNSMNRSEMLPPSPPLPPIISSSKKDYYLKSSSTSYSYHRSVSHQREQLPPHVSSSSYRGRSERGSGGSNGGRGNRFSKHQISKSSPPLGVPHPVHHERNESSGGGRRGHSNRSRY